MMHAYVQFKSGPSSKRTVKEPQNTCTCKYVLNLKKEQRQLNSFLKKKHSYKQLYFIERLKQNTFLYEVFSSLLSNFKEKIWLKCFTLNVYETYLHVTPMKFKDWPYD